MLRFTLNLLLRRGGGVPGGREGHRTGSQPIPQSGLPAFTQARRKNRIPVHLAEKIKKNKISSPPLQTSPHEQVCAGEKTPPQAFSCTKGTPEKNKKAVEQITWQHHNHMLFQCNETASPEALIVQHRSMNATDSFHLHPLGELSTTY